MSVLIFLKVDKSSFGIFTNLFRQFLLFQQFNLWKILLIFCVAIKKGPSLASLFLPNFYLNDFSITLNTKVGAHTRSAKDQMMMISRRPTTVQLLGRQTSTVNERTNKQHWRWFHNEGLFNFKTFQTASESYKLFALHDDVIILI